MADCRHFRKLIEAIPSRMHDEKRPGDVLKVPGDPLDDVADDARYGIYTFITTTEKPRELAIAEDCGFRTAIASPCADDSCQTGGQGYRGL